MSSFICEHCGARCIDTVRGYINGCHHYPVNAKPTIPELVQFVKKEFGAEEYAFVERFRLLSMGIGPKLTAWEDTLLLFLIKAWEDHLWRK